jgi:excinuclease UvrABC ATPase subunit
MTRTPGELRDALRGLTLSAREAIIAEAPRAQLEAKLATLLDLGLDYLTLDRRANTLSGGEMQRLRLAAQIGAGLTGVLYVLDEPTIGLHGRDTGKLIGAMRALVTAGRERAGGRARRRGDSRRRLRGRPRARRRQGRRACGVGGRSDARC